MVINVGFDFCDPPYVHYHQLLAVWRTKSNQTYPIIAFRKRMKRKKSHSIFVLIFLLSSIHLYIWIFFFGKISPIPVPISFTSICIIIIIINIVQHLQFHYCSKVFVPMVSTKVKNKRSMRVFFFQKFCQVSESDRENSANQIKEGLLSFEFFNAFLELTNSKSFKRKSRSPSLYSHHMSNTAFGSI